MKTVGEAGVNITVMPPECENVVVVQGNEKTMVLRIPSKKLLESSEDDLLYGVVYPIPSYYAALYGGQAQLPTSQDQAALMWLHANRMGEYTMNNCD
jgi:hypothetical protein